MSWTCNTCTESLPSWAGTQRHADAHVNGSGHGARLDVVLVQDRSDTAASSAMGALAEVVERAALVTERE